MQGYSSLGFIRWQGYKNCAMTLIDIPAGEQVRMGTVEGRHLFAKLTQIGLHPGDCLRVLRVAPMGGPVLVEVNGREIALGRGVAEKIIVEVICE